MEVNGEMVDCINTKGIQEMQMAMRSRARIHHCLPLKLTRCFSPMKLQVYLLHNISFFYETSKAI